jgi:hypothetical protein
MLEARHSERSEESSSDSFLDRNRARFLAEFTLSELQRSFAALRMTANGLGMTGFQE